MRPKFLLAIAGSTQTQMGTSAPTDERFTVYRRLRVLSTIELPI
jgi:hypothetical protein